MDKTDLPPGTFTLDPQIHPSVFIAPGAQVMGNVTLGEDSSVWYNAVLRGDINAIKIGDRTNIQDGCILHVTNDDPCIIANDVTVGHHVNLHGCRVEEGCLIGIGAIVLSGAHIKRNSVVAAGAVVLEGMVVEENSLVVGVPGKKIRSVEESNFQKNLLWAKKYRELAQIHKKKLGMD